MKDLLSFSGIGQGNQSRPTIRERAVALTSPFRNSFFRPALVAVERNCVSKIPSRIRLVSYMNCHIDDLDFLLYNLLLNAFEVKNLDHLLSAMRRYCKVGTV